MSDDPGQRVLILLPTTKDAGVARTMLEQMGISGRICADKEDLCRSIKAGAAAVLLSEEVFSPRQPGPLARVLDLQPPWSDLPVLALARPGADSEAVASAMERLGNVTVLERPVRMTTLVSAVRAALRARQRQYQIRDHLADLARTEEALRETDRRKDEFLAVLAHELRNPLAPLRNGLEVLALARDDDPLLRRVGEMMERQVAHMVRLIDDLMEVSRITRGLVEIRRRPVDLAAVVADAVETSRPLVDAGGHELTVAVPERPLIVDGDEVRLGQVVTNLLNNAAKYTLTPGWIRLSAERDGPVARISVEDNGRGIPPEMIPRVFDLFTQVDRSPSRVRGGLGIGLTLVRRLVELHGGHVEARSEGIGKGSTFVVTLPLAATAPAPVEAAPPAGAGGLPSHAALPRSFAGATILVVDDERDASESLAMLLRHLQAEVRTVNSGAAALDLLERWKPAAILLDIGMPGMDGYETARRIRGREDLENVAVIALTGLGQAGDRERSLQAGFDHHLVKPLDLSALHGLVRELPEIRKRRGPARRDGVAEKRAPLRRAVRSGPPPGASASGAD